MKKWLLILALLATLSGCGYNDFQRLDEQVKSAWSEVLNQYQRRADLIPNIVATVKGEASFEQDTLTKVIEARSKATSIQATPELVNDPAAFQRYQQAQNNLSTAILPLRVLQENYPDLKSNANFMALQSQLEGTENRIAIARRDYNQTAQDYNTTLRTFPTVLWAKTMYAGQKPAVLFSATADAQSAPTVSFEPTAPAVTGPPAPSPASAPPAPK